MKMRGIAGLMGIGLLMSSCGGSAASEAGESADAEPGASSVTDTTPTVGNVADELPGDGEIVYASSDALCTEEVDGEPLAEKTPCPDGATDYWFLSDNTFVVDTTDFGPEVRLTLIHEASITTGIEWTQQDGLKLLYQDEVFSEFVSIEGDYLVIDHDLCAWNQKKREDPNTFPTEFVYESLDLAIEYEFSPKTIEDRGLVFTTNSPSLYHEFSTNPATFRPEVQQGDQALFDHIHNAADACHPELDLTGPTYTPERTVERLGRPEK